MVMHILAESIVVSVLVLIIAIAIDLLVGDPSPNNPSKLRFKLHPTVIMGKLTKALEPHFKSSNPKVEKLNGVFLALTVIFTFALPVFFGLWFLFTWLHLLFYAAVATVILKFTVCIKLETDWANAAAKAIAADNLNEARKYSHFSRRDSKDLTGAQIGSAVIESMAENLIDFKLSPIIAYAFLGVTGAVAFRAVNTLDGMVGFKDREHINTGWFSANLDTVVNYIPARLTAVLIVLASALLGADYKNAWSIARRDNAKTPSRNHGWPMAAMAGALRVQLEKPGQYVLGEPDDALSADKVLLALRIRDVSIVLCILFALPILVLVRLFLFPF
ncbi:MAG: cobalamin biosynthesis protein [Candidatus Bathyarchaeota archaeon]|nr:cobalamin biosynthesis protein [Candidatus Bathyarchaeota archaeon]